MTAENPASEVADAPAPPRPPLVPELATRLEAHLAAQRKVVLELAEKYERALSLRTEAAADAGDLPLVKAFREEADHLEALKMHLAEEGGDPAARIKEPATLPELDSGAPESLVLLRQAWTSERARIKADLDEKLGRDGWPSRPP